MIHTVKGFGIVNKAEVYVFLEFSWFFDDPADVGIWSLVPLPFLNPLWTSGSSQYMNCWSLTWRTVSITLLACEMSAIVQKFEHSLALPFFGIGMKTNFFHSGCHCWVFLYFFSLITEERFLIYPCYSLELCIQMGISFLFSFAFCFSSFHS